ncbi:transmembrane protein, putative [Bodo saltans]|uniref:Transmembrane protein, putative n=1 Tax=Bodo saltans TaxID=75058 RepID=A0A0S4IND3_BODSA|nr:transmembrane protein, putative [Bodo saltans]|eukprot:CUF65202.1 transmembrane protein, putative [Bodo saltans]
MRCAGSCCATAVRMASTPAMKRSMAVAVPSTLGSKSVSSITSSSSNALVCSTRTFAKPSAVQGPITNSKEGTYVSTEIIVDMSQALGGQYARGMFAKRDMAYGREILNIPAFLMYIGDEPQREQVLILTKEVFSKLVLNHPDKKFIEARILTMASGGFSYFTRERDVQEFAETVKIPNSFKTGADYLQAGEYGTFDLQKLPLILDFNRWDVEYRGRKGICIFPEAQYFNHQCDANVEISISYSKSKENFVLSARTIKPIQAGEELFINYLPGNTLPLSRLSLALRKRWGFECTCVVCKSRAIGAVTVIFVAVCLPFAIFMRSVYVARMDSKQRGL